MYNKIELSLESLSPLTHITDIHACCYPHISEYVKTSLSSVFHTLAYMETHKCISILIGIYVFIVFFYGVIWTIIGVNCPECNLEIDNLLEGCLFSLEV